MLPRRDQEEDEGNDGGALQPHHTDSSGTRVVRLLPFEFFRRKLIEHFEILFERRKIVWPRRNARTGKVRRLMREMGRAGD